MNTSTFIQKLQQQLAQYGLNPKEWEIRTEEDGTVRIVNDEIEMKGTVCVELGEWLDLKIVH